MRMCACEHRSRHIDMAGGLHWVPAIQRLACERQSHHEAAAKTLPSASWRHVWLPSIFCNTSHLQGQPHRQSLLTVCLIPEGWPLMIKISEFELNHQDQINRIKVSKSKIRLATSRSRIGHICQISMTKSEPGPKIRSTWR